jgi:hypothetical protein
LLRANDLPLLRADLATRRTTNDDGNTILVNALHQNSENVTRSLSEKSLVRAAYVRCVAIEGLLHGQALPLPRPMASSDVIAPLSGVAQTIT